MRFWYVLFVRTGSEESVRQKFADRLDPKMFKPFVPRRVVMIRRKDIVRQESEVCFPGYVFIQSEYAPEEFKARLFPIVFGVKEAYKILSYDDDGEMIALSEEEKAFASKLLGDNFTVEKSVGVIIGDNVKVTSGALVGNEGIIKKINRHKRQAIIEMKIMGDTRRLTVELEIIGKI